MVTEKNVYRLMSSNLAINIVFKLSTALEYLSSFHIISEYLSTSTFGMFIKAIKMINNVANDISVIYKGPHPVRKTEMACSLHTFRRFSHRVHLLFLHLWFTV